MTICLVLRRRQILNYLIFLPTRNHLFLPLLAPLLPLLAQIMGSPFYFSAQVSN